jgi:hypothetical protein
MFTSIAARSTSTRASGTVEQGLRPLEPHTEPATSGCHGTHCETTQSIRTHLPVWTWEGEDVNVSCAKLRLTLEEAAGLKDRFQTLLEHQEIWTFVLEDEPADALTYAEMLQNTPALWTTPRAADDEPIEPAEC